MPPESGVQQVVRPIVKVAGANLPVSTIQHLVEITVDTSLDMPDMFVLRFQDDQFELIDGSTLDLGKEVEIGFMDSRNQPVTIMKGEITALEPQYLEDVTWLIVRGYDKRHRLTLGTHIKVFLNQKDSEIVNTVAAAAGLSVDVEATTVQHPYVCQHDQTDLEFIKERARLNGYEVGFKDGKLTFKKPGGARTRITLTRGQELRSFTPRLSAANQVKTVVVQGWDPKQKQKVQGQATSSSSQPQIGYGKNGGAAAQSAFSAGSAKYIEVRYDVTQAQAAKLAQAILDDINAGFVEAEGVAIGNPNIKAGCEVDLKKLGTRFSGTYVVTSATHVYNAESYDTCFRIEGKQPKLISDLTNGHYDSHVFRQWQGVVPAIVTNNQDPENLARVKVKFPWLSDQEESNWARLAAPGAGAQRGIWWMPEVNDEVLVAFEQGDFNRPIILGGLWNGKDATPETTANTVKSGKVVRRTYKSRLGHTIRFVEEDSNDYIEIVDSKQGTTIKMDAKSKALSIECKGDITIKSTGNTKVEATGNLEMKSSANVSIKGTGNVNVEATGQLVLKGAMVNIN